MSAGWITPVESGVRIDARVTPRASKNEIRGGEEQLAVRVTAAPDSGQANAAVIKLLAKQLRCAKSSISIVRGETSRNKLLQIDGVSEREVLDALAS